MHYCQHYYLESLGPLGYLGIVSVVILKVPLLELGAHEKDALGFAFLFSEGFHGSMRQ